MYNKERVDYLLQQEKTEDVVNELIELNMGLIHKQIRRFGLYNDPDALSYSYEALYNAIMSYNHSHKFSTFASVCIYNRLGSHVRSLNTQINVNTSYYEETIGDTDLTVLDTLESPYTADSTALHECGTQEVQDAVCSSMKTLTNLMHIRIVETWVYSGFEMTHVRIAEEVGCTQVYVTQVLKKFRETMRRKLECKS